MSASKKPRKKNPRSMPTTLHDALVLDEEEAADVAVEDSLPKKGNVALNTTYASTVRNQDIAP